MGGINAVNNDGSAQMVVVLSIKVMSYSMAGLFYDLERPLFVFLFVTLSFLAALFVLIRP